LWLSWLGIRVLCDPTPRAEGAVAVKAAGFECFSGRCARGFPKPGFAWAYCSHNVCGGGLHDGRLYRCPDGGAFAWLARQLVEPIWIGSPIERERGPVCVWVLRCCAFDAKPCFHDDGNASDDCHLALCQAAQIKNATSRGPRVNRTRHQHMPRRVLFLTVMPSPYQRQLFQALQSHSRMEIRVLYCAHSAPDRHWSIDPLSAYEEILPGSTIDWLGPSAHFNRGIIEVLKKDSSELFVLSDYSAPTTQ